MLGRTLEIARRELAAIARSPAHHAVWALFLALEGWAFWLLAALADGHAMPRSAALGRLYGGTLLWWIGAALLAAALTMRAVAEERRAGTLEVLLAAPVSPGEVAAGKYAAALAAWCVAWAPTTLYLIWLARGGPLDEGALACVALGTFAVGAGTCALGLAASSLSRHQLAAAAVTVGAVAGLVAAGPAVDAAPGWARPLLARLAVTRQLEACARGRLPGELVALWGALAIVSLAVARAALALPASARAARRRLAASLIAAATAAGALGLAAPHLTLSVGDSGEARLSPALAALADRAGELRATVVWPDASGDDLGRMVADLLDRVRARDPRLSVTWTAALDGEVARALADRAAIAPEELPLGGVLIERGGHARFVPRAALGRFALDDAGDPALAAFSGDGALAAALAALVGDAPEVACFTAGHGEAAPDSLAGDGASDLAAALAARGITSRAVDLAPATLRGCAVVVAAGPRRPLAADETAALTSFAERGGPVVALLAPDAGPGDLAPLLARRGVTAAAPLAAPARVEHGYGDHPAVAALAGRRTTFRSARTLAVAPPAVALASDDASGAILAAATASGPRLAAIGSDAPARNDGAASWNRDLAAAAIEWAARGAAAAPAAEPLPLLRLSLTPRERTSLFLCCVLFLPALAGSVGFAAWLRRRR